MAEAAAQPGANRLDVMMIGAPTLSGYRKDQINASRIIASLATKMRLTQQATTNHGGNKIEARKPWEFSRAAHNFGGSRKDQAVVFSHARGEDGVAQPDLQPATNNARGSASGGSFQVAKAVRVGRGREKISVWPVKTD
jgi:hypothetical protein